MERKRRIRMEEEAAKWNVKPEDLPEDLFEDIGDVMYEEDGSEVLDEEDDSEDIIDLD